MPTFQPLPLRQRHEIELPAGATQLIGASAATPGTGVAAHSDLVFETVSTRAGFDSLETEWNGLFDSAGRDIHVFQRFNWLWHWTNHYLDRADGKRPTRQLAIVVARHRHRVVMIWPLVMERGRLVRQLIWMGEPVSQYGDILIEPGRETAAMMRSAWAYIRAHLRPDVVRLRKVRHDSNIAALLCDLSAIESDRAEAPYLDLGSAPDFDHYEERYSAKARKNRRRLLRRLAQRSSVEFEHHRDGDTASDLARLAITLKRAWLKDRGLISPALSDPRMVEFFGDVAHGRGRSNGCHVSALHVGGEPASIEIGFSCKSRLALHVIVYALKFEKSGAGVVHLEDSLRRASGAGLKTCDLLAPRADYKMDWADGTVAVSDFTLPLSWRGEIYGRIYLIFIRERMKSMFDRLPPALRKAAASINLALAPGL